MKNKIKIILLVIVVVIAVDIPIFIIVSSGVGYHNWLITSCLTYAYLTNSFFAYWIVKNIINKLKW